MRKILLLLFFILMLSGTVQAITIASTDNDYRTVERTKSDTITITSDDGAATTHWILDGVDLGTNVLSQALTYNTEKYYNLTIYQTNGPLTSNSLYFIIIVTPFMDNTTFTHINQTLADNVSTAITNSNFTEIITIPRDYYTNAMNLLFYVFVWGIFAGMMYIRQNTWHIPAILAIIMSAVIMSQIPDAYRGLVQFGTIAGAFAVIYIFFKSKR